MIGLLPPGFAGTWHTTVSADGNYVVVDESISDFDLALIRRPNRKIGVLFDPFLLPRDDRPKAPLAEIELAGDVTVKQARENGVIAMDEPAALAKIQLRAKNLGDRPFDAFFVITRVRYRNVWRMGDASRKLAFAKTGLDPYDFRDAFEISLDPEDPARRREAFPEPLRAFLAESGQARYREAIAPLEGKPVHLVVDSRLPSMTPLERLSARADWTKTLDFPGLAGLALRATGPASAKAAKEIEAVSKLPLTWFGNENDFRGFPDVKGRRLLRPTVP